MRDTIGYHLDRAISWAVVARDQHEHGDLTLGADCMGRSLGHAFRAAELAYDLGMTGPRPLSRGGLGYMFKCPECKGVSPMGSYRWAQNHLGTCSRRSRAR